MPNERSEYLKSLARRALNESVHGDCPRTTKDLLVTIATVLLTEAAFYTSDEPEPF